TIENVGPRFVSNVFELGDELWAVHAVMGSAGNSALRWYRIRETTNNVLQTGLIEDTTRDFHEPSIAVNDANKVIIGYTCSGPNLAPSTCVSIGTIGLPTAFEPPRILRTGAGHYWQDFNDPPDAERNRWGDYSATVIDPVYPCTFWTFQEFVAVSAVGDVGPSPLQEGGQWGTQITELTFDPPVMTIPGDLVIEDTCVGESGTTALEICNTSSHTGVCANLVIDAITSDDPQFEVVEPSSGFPVVISPDFCFPFQVRFTPSDSGPDSATLTVESSDPLAPTAEVTVTSGSAGPDVRVTGSSDFGNVCAGTLAEKRISVCNVGVCNLTVSGADFEPPCDDFTLINRWFPAEVSHDFCMDLILRFTPQSAGPKSCTLVIHTDDPDTPDRPVVVTGNTPVPSIDVPDDLGFPPTVVNTIGACSTPLPFPVSNTGTCNLAITELAITQNPEEYALAGRPSYPILLEPGHIAGEGDLQTVFAPDVLDRDEQGQLRVTWVSDPITGATTSVTRALCGEGVNTGARVLVRAGGVPVPMVEALKIQRINANRNRNQLDTADNARDLPLVAVIPAPPCGPFQYHREYGTVSNPIQLLPGSYQVTATVRIGGHRSTKVVGFDVSTCDFNPTIIVDF
ncbi:MAG: choice-of-anchor D domain-containing protein, partial [Candidatus Polarisedimenticolia bacterium]